MRLYVPPKLRQTCNTTARYIPEDGTYYVLLFNKGLETVVACSLLLRISVG
jgi:hypothetical protein